MTREEALARLVYLENSSQIRSTARSAAEVLLTSQALESLPPSGVEPEYGAVRLMWGERRFRVTPGGDVIDMEMPGPARDANYVASVV